MKDIVIREIRDDEIPYLQDFLYEAIFIPEGIEPPDRSIIEKPELKLYIGDFGSRAGDFCLIAESEGKPVGAVWTRIMEDYGHVDDETPSLAISLIREYRGQGTGTRLMREILKELKLRGCQSVSLSVHKGNYALKVYEKTGFKIIAENSEEYIMLCDLQQDTGNNDFEDGTEDNTCRNIERSRNMILLNVIYKCRPGKREEFLQKIKAEGIDAASRGEDGNSKYEYYLPLDSSDDLLLVEKWRDADALAAHGRQPHYARLGQLKPEYVIDTCIERFEV